MAGSRAKLRDYFLKNIGKVLTHKELQEVAGNVAEFGRRIRELRNEEGLNIQTHRDRSDLKPGQYVLTDSKPRPAFARGISKETRAYVLDRNGQICQMCGAVAGDPDPYNPGRPIRLQVGHIVDKSMGGSDEQTNLRALCSNCNEGAANITLERPSYLKLFTQVRRGTTPDLIKLLEWLVQKFPDRAKDFLDSQKTR